MSTRIRWTTSSRLWVATTKGNLFRNLYFVYCILLLYFYGSSKSTYFSLFNPKLTETLTHKKSHLFRNLHISRNMLYHRFRTKTIYPILPVPIRMETMRPKRTTKDQRKNMTTIKIIYIKWTKKSTESNFIILVFVMGLLLKLTLCCNVTKNNYAKSHYKWTKKCDIF